MESILNALQVALICLEVLLIFNLVIVVHELGHFLAARWRGLVIDRFGIWFGKPIWKKRYNGVDYCLGWIPAGGYVALPQMASMETIEGKNNEEPKKLPPIKPVDKIIVAIAGPLFSILLAFVFAVIVMLVGKPVSMGDEQTIIGYVFPESPAANATCKEDSALKGLREGDKILEVDGKPVSRFNGMNDSVKWRIVRSEEDLIPFVVEREGRRLTFLSGFKQEERPKWLRSGMREVGIVPEQQPMVGAVKEGSAPEKAGFKPNDIIEKVNGHKVYSQFGLDDLFNEDTSQPNIVTIRRLDKGTNKYSTMELTMGPMHPLIEAVPKVPNSPAIKAGLEPGDLVVAVDGHPIYNVQSLIEYTKNGKGAEMVLTIQRKGQEQQIKVTPSVERLGENSSRTGYKMGIALGDGFEWDAIGETTLKHANPIEEIVGGVTTMVNTFSAILSPRSNIKLEHLGGPVQITRVYYLLLESKDGWRRALWFSILLNVNLAVMNMLPLPVLDGGHITLALLEMIRRRPINARFLEALQTSCALLLIGFMLYVTYFDVGDLNLFGGGKKPPFEFVERNGSAPP